jgi:hypothetical protein
MLRSGEMHGVWGASTSDHYLRYLVCCILQAACFCRIKEQDGEGCVWPTVLFSSVTAPTAALIRRLPHIISQRYTYATSSYVDAHWLIAGRYALSALGNYFAWIPAHPLVSCVLNAGVRAELLRRTIACFTGAQMRLNYYFRRLLHCQYWGHVFHWMRHHEGSHHLWRYEVPPPVVSRPALHT